MILERRAAAEVAIGKLPCHTREPAPHGRLPEGRDGGRESRNIMSRELAYLLPHLWPAGRARAVAAVADTAATELLPARPGPDPRAAGWASPRQRRAPAGRARHLDPVPVCRTRGRADDAATRAGAVVGLSIDTHPVDYRRGVAGLALPRTALAGRHAAGPGAADFLDGLHHRFAGSLRARDRGAVLGHEQCDQRRIAGARHHVRGAESQRPGRTRPGPRWCCR